MAEHTPFEISISDDKISLLKQKLALATFPDELEDSGWDYGAPLSDIKRLVARYRSRWHGKLNIHYIHKKSDAPDAIPLLFVHGWPGSFIEVRKILPLLTEASDKHPSFHVVALSLPGFGFSEAPRKKGFAHPQYAEVAHKLMLAIGYNEYVTQGGDWGFTITHQIALLYGKKHSKAWHTNYPLMAPPEHSSSPMLSIYDAFARRLGWYSASERKSLERTTLFFKNGNGYAQIQSTQPQTLGYGLADSPVGLLAWIYEKLVKWTDEYPWDDDEVLTWISIYWFSRAGPAASVRIYKEVLDIAGGNMWKVGSEPTSIPLGISYFPKEIIRWPRRWTKRPGIVFEADHDSGGHFAAHEKPGELVGDLRKMFGKQSPVQFKSLVKS
ncbi:Alpha/Beta hydrolase protein [Cyathus striatus]|nr:Alpha/Beta hydrolase protein [Cyathus striatus]